MLDYKTMKIEDIIDWCVANKQTKWLKTKAQEKREYKVYPRVEKDGKMVADKSQKPTVEERPISFIHLKKDFVEEFMPAIAPKKPKEKTMYELIAELED